MHSQPLEIINRLRSSLGVSTLAELARFLDVSPQAINGAIRKRQIPDVWLYKVAYRIGKRVEWLQSGNGPEFTLVAAEEMEKYRRDSPPALQSLTKQWRELSKAEREIVDNALNLLLSSDADTRALMVDVLRALVEHHHSRDKK